MDYARCKIACQKQVGDSEINKIWSLLHQENLAVMEYMMKI